jgi:pSer/pThr/pTyr-binding forkhead associated (FHA) protein
MDGGSSIALDKPIMLIGRHQECDVHIQTSSKISRRHCCVVQCGDRYIFRDLGSMNGIRVNGHRVVETELRPGDELAIADVGFVFQRDDASAKQASRGSRRPEEEAAGRAPRHDDLSGSVPIAISEDPAPLDELPEVFADEDLADGDELRQKSDSQTGANFVGV